MRTRRSASGAAARPSRKRTPASPRRVIAERDIGFAFQDVDHLRLVDMVVAAGLPAWRDLSEDHLETGAEFAIDETAVDGAGMRRRRIGRQFRDVLDQSIGGN